MAPRTTWKGFLKLSLVSCPVRLQPATTRSNRIAFHNLNRETSNRIEMRPHDAGTGDEIDRGKLVRGYEIDRDRFVLVEEQDLESIEIEASRTIELTRFVDRSEIDSIYYDSPYYLAPDGPVADETFRVIHAAMRARDRAGLGRAVLSSREHLVIVETRGEGMLLTTLRTADEVRADKEYFAEIPDAAPEPEMVALAMRIIEERKGKFEPARLEDRHQAALQRLVEAKMAGEEPVSPSVAEKQPSATVLDLMAQLKRSLQDVPSAGGSGKAASRRPARARKATEKAPTRRKKTSAARHHA